MPVFFLFVFLVNVVHCHKVFATLAANLNENFSLLIKFGIIRKYCSFSMASDSEDEVFFDSLEIREDWPGRDRLLVEIEAIFSFAFDSAPLTESAFSTLKEEVQACMVQWDSMMAITKDNLEGDGLRQCCIKNLIN